MVHTRRGSVGCLVPLALLLIAGCTPDEGAAPGGGPGDGSDAAYDLLIRGGTVVDGTGEPAFEADIAVQGDRIVRVARDGIPEEEARDVIDASGLVVAPGFIDNHAHNQTAIRNRPLAENFIRQGITSTLGSVHSMSQPWPLDEFVESFEAATNMAFFAGHTFARRQVLGEADRAPTPEELEEMKGIVEASMEAGAIGLSTGLFYAPGRYAETEEVIELARVAARYGGVYYTHMRDEGDHVLDAVREAIRIGAEGGLPVQIQHHKAAGTPNWGRTEASIALIDEARAEGLDVSHDVYPYTAMSGRGSVAMFPPWAQADGRQALRDRIRDPELGPRIEEELTAHVREHWVEDYMDRIQFRRISGAPEYEGRFLGDLARDRGLPETPETAVDLIIELELEGGFGAIEHFMHEDDMIRVMQHPHSMFQTDGDGVPYGVGHPHPRSYGSYPRILGRYVREMGVLELEEAIHKMTWMAARQIGEVERGRIAEGAYADVTVFDPEGIRDLATYTDPHQYSVGVHHVLVNGVPVIRNASITGEMPGRVLKGPPRPDRVADRN